MAVAYVRGLSDIDTTSIDDKLFREPALEEERRLYRYLRELSLKVAAKRR